MQISFPAEPIMVILKNSYLSQPLNILKRMNCTTYFKILEKLLNKKILTCSLYGGKEKDRGTQRQFSENICSEDVLRSRIFGTFVVNFLACLPLLGFSNI